MFSFTEFGLIFFVSFIIFNNRDFRNNAISAEKYDPRSKFFEVNIAEADADV